MLGFLKRKKKDQGTPPDQKDAPIKEDSTPESSSEKPAKKRRLPIKLIVVILLVLIAVGASGFVVYKFWFSGKSGGDDSPVYKPVALVHVSLPEEMLRFTFEHLPEVYDAFVDFNREVTLIEQEVDRIDQIVKAYPEQEKIALKEKKVWEKTRDSLKKAFLKIEKPVKETYVLFRVNDTMGRVQVQEKNQELTQAAQSALAPAREMTVKLGQTDKVPEGLIKGTIYKLKKKFL